MSGFALDGWSLVGVGVAGFSEPDGSAAQDDLFA